VIDKKEEMGYDNASPFEQLLIDNVMIIWLSLQWVEYQLVSLMDQGEIRMSR